MNKLLKTSDDYGLTLARLVLGAVFFAQQMGIPAPLAFLAIMAEFLGGLGLIVGAVSRVAAFGIFSVMAVGIATVHWPGALSVDRAWSRRLGS